MVLIVVIAQLRILFQELITSNMAYIRPKEELIHLTLVDAKQENEEQEVKRRQSLATNASHSLLDSDIPNLIDVDDNSVPQVPTSSPTLIPLSAGTVPETQGLAQTAASDIANHQIISVQEDADYEFVDHESNDSGGVVSMATSDPMSIDKENAPQLRGIDKPSVIEKSPLKDNSQQINVMATEVQDLDDADMPDLITPLTPPATPPAVPPRPPPRRKSTWGVMKYGSQQDVTECITNCLSQLHAGFKPDDKEANGNGIDIFKRFVWLYLLLT
jgi:hypothetical protein